MYLKSPYASFFAECTLLVNKEPHIIDYILFIPFISLLIIMHKFQKQSSMVNHAFHIYYVLKTIKNILLQNFYYSKRICDEKFSSSKCLLNILKGPGGSMS